MAGLRSVAALLAAGVILCSGCTHSNDAELAKARAEADAARADAATARAEAEAAKAALPKPPPAGLRIWRDTEAEELCKLLKIEADCFKYEGGWVAGWVEIDVAGKKNEFGVGEDLLRTALNHDLKQESAAGKRSGSLVWVRRSENMQEAWDLAFKLKDAAGQEVSSSKVTTAPPPHGPPQPASPGKPRLVRGDSEIALKDGQVVTLVTLETVGEKDGQIARSVKLQCKALK